MGIIKPRPAMRAKERRTVEETLRHHAELMKRFEADGLSRDEASHKAYVTMQTEKSAGATRKR